MDSLETTTPVVGVGRALHGSDAKGGPYAIDNVRWLVRQALHAFGLGRLNPHAPLADIIKPGMNVLLKPNWVLDYNQGGQTMECMVTHPIFIEVALEEVLRARPRRVIIGDAPIQLCQFDKLVPSGWQRSLQQLSAVPVHFEDFRRHRVRGKDMADGVDSEARPVDRYVLFDLGCESLLEPISRPGGRFRVTNYDSKALSQAHRPGHHEYLLCREAFEADVVVNLPKLKTHRKTGITGALKNLVGLNGNKDYLPHHRVGGSFLGGDCYSGLAPLKRIVEFCLDQANQRINSLPYKSWHDRAFKILQRHRWFGDDEIEGGWHGNDTAWRMVLDLNRLLLYGRADGTLADVSQRRVYSLTDAIIVGHGEGPLAPEPLELGAVTFASSCAFAELVHASLLNFDYRRLAIVREAFGKIRYPLTTLGPDQCVVRVNDQAMGLETATERFGVVAKAPRGWVGHLEKNPDISVEA